MSEYRNIYIKITGGPHKGKNLHFTKNIVTFGRDSNNDVALPDDPGIAERHAEITRKGRHFVLVDSSVTGTFLNGRRVEEAPLANVSELRLGSTVVEVKLRDRGGEGGPAKPSLLRRPLILAGGGAYLLALTVLVVILSGSKSPSQQALAGEQLESLVKEYRAYALDLGIPNVEQDSIRLQSLLRAAFIAEKQGLRNEAAALYRRIATEHHQNRWPDPVARVQANPVYRFALSRLDDLD